MESQEKTNYRILHHGGRSWLQFEHKSTWRYIRDNATGVYDCPKGIGWRLLPSMNFLNANDDGFFTELWVKQFPNINEYFELNRKRLQAQKDYQKSIIYINQ